MRRLPLNLRRWTLRLACVCRIDGLRWLFAICGSLQLFFFLLDEGALISPVAFVFVVNAAVGDFLFPAGVLFPTTIGIASIAPPSSVVLRPGVAGFVTGDRVHGLWGLRLLGLIWLRSVAIARPLLIHLFDPPALSSI